MHDATPDLLSETSSAVTTAATTSTIAEAFKEKANRGPGGASLISWTDDEKRQMVDYARRHCLELEQLNLRNAYLKIQDATLPPDRRKNAENPNVQCWLRYESKKPIGAPHTPNYDAIRKERAMSGDKPLPPSRLPKAEREARIAAKNAAPIAKLNGAAPPIEAHQPPASIPTPAAIPAPIPAAPQPAPLESRVSDVIDAPAPRTLGEQIAEAAGTFLGSFLAKALRHEPLHDALRGLMATIVGKEHVHEDQQPLPAHSFKSSSNVLRKPKVLIAGLKGHQMRVINEECKEAFELRFWHTDQSLDALRRTASECDIAVGFVNFLPHTADAIMKSRAAKFVRHTGGLDTLKSKLMGLHHH